MMKIQSITKKKSRNSLKKTKSKKSSPYYKENINHISSKYLSLLKGKRNSSKKRLEEKKLRQTNLNTVQSKSTRSIISKNSPDHQKSFSKSFIKNQKIKKNIKGKDRENKKKSKKPKKSQKFYNNIRLVEKGFRSPPLPKRLKKNQFQSIYNSTGKITIEKRTKIKKSKIGPASYKNKESVKIIKEENYDFKGNIILLNNNIGINENCLNHSDKKSTFFLDLVLNIKKDKYFEKILQGFCSLCAVHLVKQGFDCKEIMTKEEIVRKKKIENFVEDLENERENCSKTENVLKLKLDDLKKNYEIQTDKINSFYSNLYEQLEKKRNSYIKDLDNIFTNNKKKLNSELKKYKMTNQEFEHIYKDIKEHYEKIIKVIDLGPFNNILDKYRDTLNEYVKFSLKSDNIEVIFSNVDFKKNIEEISKNSDPIAEIKMTKSLLIQKKEIDLTESIKSIENEKIIGSRIDEKSDVYVSFDENYQNTNSQFEEERDINKMPRNSENAEKYDKILTKISNSQKEQKIYYNNLLNSANLNEKEVKDEKKNQFHKINSNEEFQNPNSNEEFQKSNFNDEFSDSDQQVFEIIDDNNWEMKQTPDLGGEKNGDYLKNHLDNICKDYMNNEINRNISQNLINSDLEEGINIQLKCKKKLFQ